MEATRRLSVSPVPHRLLCNPSIILTRNIFRGPIRPSRHSPKSLPFYYSSFVWPGLCCLGLLCLDIQHHYIVPPLDLSHNREIQQRKPFTHCKTFQLRQQPTLSQESISMELSTVFLPITHSLLLHLKANALSHPTEISLFQQLHTVSKSTRRSRSISTSDSSWTP